MFALYSALLFVHMHDIIDLIVGTNDLGRGKVFGNKVALLCEDLLICFPTGDAQMARTGLLLCVGLLTFSVHGYLYKVGYAYHRTTQSSSPLSLEAAEPRDWALPLETSQRIVHATNLEVCSSSTQLLLLRPTAVS